MSATADRPAKKDAESSGKAVAKRPRARTQRPSGNRGRPTKLTGPVREAVYQSLTLGCWRESAARAAGIGLSTFYEWLERGREDAEAGVRTIYVDFAEGVERAEAEAEVRRVARLDRHAEKEPRVDMWHLERRYPKRWGKREELEITGGTENRVTVSVEVVPEGDQRAEIARILAESGAHGEIVDAVVVEENGHRNGDEP